MKYKLELNQELVPVLDALKNQPAPPSDMSLQDIFRNMTKQVAESIRMESTDKVKIENHYFTNSEGVQTRIRVFTPVSGKEAKPLLYWIHGGGTMSGLPEQEDPMLHNLAAELNCIVTSIDYRLTPENPYPIPLNDCYEGLTHLATNAGKFGIDGNRIIVGGGSAGGLLSTSCAIKARNENGPKLLLQYLEYPMLDNRSISQSNKEITDLGVWDAAVNKYAFGCYLKDLDEEAYKNAVPNLVEDLSNLPDAFVMVGTMDCLRDEGIEYAQKLAAAGNQIELHILPGVVHAFDVFAPTSQIAQQYWKIKIAALKRSFETL